MSRSRRRTPVCGITTAETEKDDKRFANRRIRRAVRKALRVNPEAEVLPHQRELSDPWTMRKDGKLWFDAAKHPAYMRK